MPHLSDMMTLQITMGVEMVAYNGSGQSVSNERWHFMCRKENPPWNLMTNKAVLKDAGYCQISPLLVKALLFIFLCLDVKSQT